MSVKDQSKRKRGLSIDQSLENKLDQPVKRKKKSTVLNRVNFIETYT